MAKQKKLFFENAYEKKIMSKIRNTTINIATENIMIYIPSILFEKMDKIEILYSL